MSRETIKNYSGQIIAYIDTDSNGVQTLKTYIGTILGYYKPDRNITQNYSGTILSQGNTLGMLIPNEPKRPSESNQSSSYTNNQGKKSGWDATNSSSSAGTREEGMPATKGSDIGMALLKNAIPPLYGVIVCFREIYLMLSGRPSEFNEPSDSSSASKQSQEQPKKEYPPLPNNNPRGEVNAMQTHSEAIRNFNGKIIAWIICKNNGDQEITDFTGHPLGRYFSRTNLTHDPYGKILGQGNILTSLIR